MNETCQAKKFIKRFSLGLGLFLLLIAGIVLLLDPFYHYHGPLPGLKTVLEERDYEVTGTLDHFDYEGLILGTSIAENYNIRQFSENFGMSFVKAIRAGGSNADLLWYLDRAYESHELKQVFYFLDLFSMESDTTPTFSRSNTDFLTNKNPFDDIEYLWNKDVLFKKIPLQLAYSFVLDYDEGNPYSWYQTKTFRTDEVMKWYSPAGFFKDQAPVEEIDPVFEENLALLEQRVAAHPDTDFTVCFSPISILWWDNEYREGRLDQVLWKLQTITDRLSVYENVTVCFFQDDTEIIKNLDNYMDILHFSESVNRLLCDRIAAGEGKVTSDSLPAKLEALRETVIRFSRSEITQYYPDAVTE